MMSRFTQWTLGLTLVTAVSLVGCGNAEQTEKKEDEAPKTAAIANEYCPIMVGPIDKEGKTVEWDGKKIGFCCPGCDKKFMALSDEEKAEKLAAAKKAAQEDAKKEEEKAS